MVRSILKWSQNDNLPNIATLSGLPAFINGNADPLNAYAQTVSVINHPDIVIHTPNAVTHSKVPTLAPQLPMPITPNGSAPETAFLPTPITCKPPISPVSKTCSTVQYTLTLKTNVAMPMLWCNLILPKPPFVMTITAIPMISLIPIRVNVNTYPYHCPIATTITPLLPMSITPMTANANTLPPDMCCCPTLLALTPMRKTTCLKLFTISR